MSQLDIRWIQRFSNYRKALARLTNAVALTHERELSELEQQGLIQAFEYTYDLAWKTLQDFLVEKTILDYNGGPNPVITVALEHGYITDETTWKKLKKSRELTSHTYDEDAADDVADNIVTVFHDLFIQLETRLQIEKLQQERKL